MKIKTLSSSFGFSSVNSDKGFFTQKNVGAADDLKLIRSVFAAAVLIIILLQSVFNIRLQAALGTVNISVNDMLGMLGIVLLLKRNIYFPLVLLLFGLLHFNSNANFQSLVRDLMPIVYIGFIYYGTILPKRTLLNILLFCGLLLTLISVYYLVTSMSAWYRFPPLTDAESIIILLFALQDKLKMMRVVRFSYLGRLMFPVMLLLILFAQISNGSRSSAIIIVIAVIMHLLLSDVFWKAITKIMVVALSLVLYSLLFRPLAYLRLLDVIQGSDDYHGGITLNYRLDNFSLLIEKTLANPIFGNGFGQYFHFRFGVENFTSHPAWIVHNDYIALLYYFGVLGSFIIGAYVASLFLMRKIQAIPDFKKNAFIAVTLTVLLATNTPVLGNATSAAVLWALFGFIFIRRRRLKKPGSTHLPVEDYRKINLLRI